MAIYLKKFENHTQYETYTASTEFITPNVSLCEQENEVHYNPYVEPPFFCKLTLSNGEIVEIEGSGQLTSAMIKAYSATTVNAEIGTLCTSIGSFAFDDYTSLTSIDIPDSVTSIGGYAFYNCYNLTSIDIPSGVTRIEDSVFNMMDGHSLTSITMSDNVTSIGNSAFSNCSSLKRLNSNVDGVFNLPSSITNIGVGAFSSCYGLISINIPSGVTTIGHDAFSGCSGLTSINIPSSVISIGDYAFCDCNLDSASTSAISAINPTALEC